MKKITKKNNKEIILNLNNTSLKIIEREDRIIIHSDKDIIFSSKGNIISSSDNYNIMFGKQIHFNPDISKDKDIIRKIEKGINHDEE